MPYCVLLQSSPAIHHVEPRHARPPCARFVLQEQRLELAHAGPCSLDNLGLLAFFLEIVVVALLFQTNILINMLGFFFLVQIVLVS